MMQSQTQYRYRLMALDSRGELVDEYDLVYETEARTYAEHLTTQLDDPNIYQVVIYDMVAHRYLPKDNDDIRIELWTRAPEELPPPAPIQSKKLTHLDFYTAAWILFSILCVVIVLGIVFGGGQ